MTILRPIYRSTKELKVEALVTGRVVQRWGDQLTISSELIDARSNRNLWGQRYDRKPSDALGVQQEITVAISAKLRERLSGDNKAQIAKGGTNSPEAYQFYLKGFYYWGKRTPEGPWVEAGFCLQFTKIVAITCSSVFGPHNIHNCIQPGRFQIDSPATSLPMAFKSAR